MDRRRKVINRWLATASLGGSGTPTILLSGGTIAENAALNTVVGLLSVANGTGPYSFSITADPDSKFAIANVNELQIDAALNYEAATSHSVTIAAADGSPIPSPRTFIVNVTDVDEGGYAPSLDFSDARNSQYIGQVV